MPNMSYCRFENTCKDLDDCKDALRNEGLGDLSEREKKYAKSLIELCRDIAEMFEGDDLDDEDDE